ncbi:SNF2-related protein [Sphingomonas sp. YL-JM2C]
MSLNFIATQAPDGAERISLLRAQKAKLFRRTTSETVPVTDWPAEAPVGGLAAIAAARATASATGGTDGCDRIVEDADGILLPPDIVARLDALDADALGLPPATALTLQLRSTGSLAEGTIAVEAKWVRRGGQTVRADILGARIREAGRIGRIPEPLHSTFQAALAVNSADSPDQRRAAFAHLREQIGDDLGDGIHVDGFIERIRIAYAATFSLDVRTDHGSFDFDPVLFARHVSESGEGELVDETEASLLTPADTRHFQRRFRAQDGGRRSYLLSDGTLLFLDPLLGQALAIVRAKQSASSEEKRDFLRSPQKVLREQLLLDATEDDGAADRLFVETQQYSERVQGIAVWQQPVLPWIKPKPNSWLPERFGLRVGDPPDDRHIELAAGDAQAILDQVEAAIAAGADSIAFGDETIPATPATLQSAKALADLERAASISVDNAPPPELAPLETFFLQVGDNFEQLDFARLPRPVAETPPFEAPPLPEGLRSTPKPHQLAAFAWLAEAWTRHLPGILLADDMGLGKTFQALMFLLWRRQATKKPGPVLVVAPTGLLRNWQAEIAQHVAPGALGEVIEAFGRYLGAYRQAAGSDIRGGTSRLDVAEWDKAGIILTTYETMRDYHMSFARVRFDVILYDEIQKLKNPASQMTRAAKALNGQLQLAMTGTPVENRLQDLWSIADTVYPGFLGTSRDFEANFSADDHGKLTSLQAQLVERDGGLPPFMLRRMKDEILTGLPEKRAAKYPIAMPPAQAQAYDLVLARARALRESGEPGAMLKVLHMLRGTSLHPDPPRGVSDIDAYVGRSARLQQSFDILETIRREGEKALLFCEDLDMQAFLATAIQQRFGLATRPMCINGGVAGQRRQEMVGAFQSAAPGFDVLILSPKAGGVGLTITAANHIIHLSRWWNPAVEDQATDRAYRIGQQRPVTVHIPMAVHPDPAIGPSSFDQRLDALMERKRALSRGLLMPPESDRDVEDLLADVLDSRQQPPAPTRQSKPPEPSSLAGSPSAKSLDEIEDLLQEGLPTSSVQPHSPDSTPPSAPTAQRPVLSVVSPVDAAMARTPQLQRIVYQPYGQRDWTIFEQYLRGIAINRLEIEDPYCCADDKARGRLVAFVQRLHSISAGLTTVHIVAYDANSIQGRAAETSNDQRADLEARWQRGMGAVKLQLSQKSRRSGSDLHDRFVRAMLSTGDIVIWDLGRGIDGVMNAKWSCVVNAFREPMPCP